MERITPVEITPLRTRITPSSRVLLLGSCFSNEVGKLLAQTLGEEQVCRNPFGVLYNPDSIALVLRVLMAEPEEREVMIRRSVFYGRDGRWHSWLGSSVVSGDTEEECLDRCRSAASVNLCSFDVLIITLGTDRCYRLVDTGEVVANCHKELASRFVETETDGTALSSQLSIVNGRWSIVLTLSPYRYRKYTLHGSQLSKAHLLMMVDAWCKKYEGIEYFPSYEIVLDELRDYCYYKEDGLHPNAEAVRYVYQRFAEAVFAPVMS